MATPLFVMRAIRNGPKTVGFRDSDVWFYLPAGYSLLCQPSLCCHAALALTAGPSLVTGWKVFDDTNYVARSLAYYGIGEERHSVV